MWNVHISFFLSWCVCAQNVGFIPIFILCRWLRCKKNKTHKLFQRKNREEKKMKSFVSVSRVVSFSLYISIRIGIRIFLFQLLFIRTKIGQRARKNVFIKNLPNQFKIFRPQIYHTGVCASIFALIQLCY